MIVTVEIAAMHRISRVQKHIKIHPVLIGSSSGHKL